MILPKDHGGLGIGSILAMNKALLFKWNVVSNMLSLSQLLSSFMLDKENEDRLILESYS
jgi:hypothetical protein